MICLYIPRFANRPCELLSKYLLDGPTPIEISRNGNRSVIELYIGPSLVSMSQALVRLFFLFLCVLCLIAYTLNGTYSQA